MGILTFAPNRMLLVASLFLAFAAILPAQDNTANEDVVKRYEQILMRAPMEGPSFDKLVQIYQGSEGLEKLDARWAPLSTQPGAKGATYSLLRGLLADRMAKTDDARKLFQAATQAQPDDYHGWMALGDFEVRQGKWADAIAALQKGLATTVTGEDRLSLYRKLGQAQERNLDLPSALATWRKMVEEFPKDPFALGEAGAAELDAEQYDEAKKTFQKLVDLTEPNSMNRVQALMKLTEVDDRQGKTDAAVHGYEAILPLTADASWLNRELRAQIEQVYRRQDDLAGLVGYYQKWTADHPKDVEALLLLAATQTELGKTSDALDVLRKVTLLAPDRHEVRQSFAQGLVEAKQYDEALTVLTALTADDPTEPRYWATMGDALWRKTQPPTPESRKAVLAAWSHIAPAESKDVAAILEVADLCHDHDLNDDALAGYQRALKISPDASDIREKTVKLLVEMNRKDDAWKLLDQMTDGALATAANELKLATLDLQFDRKDAAAEALRKGLAIEPGNFDLLSQQWGQFAAAQKWADCVALFDKLIAAAPNAYFIDQLETRHVQALTSAGLLGETEKRLHEKLGATLGLSEGELRLLLRIMTQNSDADVPKAIEEAQRRFPQSLSLNRLEIDYARHQGNFDGAISALQHLIETAPLQKTDWLSEMVHVRQDQGNLDAAMAAAQQLIAASPTNGDGYVLYAEIAIAAGKPDEAVAKLQAAIKVSEKPNDVRQRLARFYLENGQAAKARATYDEAFAAAENPQDKLTIVRAMTAAYFQDGQVEELINRFKKEQSSEESGWRYGLYLSAIYEQMDDFGAARRELAKSLAVRPQDTGLLHSLIGLTEKDGDLGELLKYRQMLAQTDPSATNEIALANEYAVQGKPDEAWRIVQKNLGEVAKDPLAWRDILNQISDPDAAGKIKDALESAIRTKNDSFEGEFALAQFQIQQGDLDAAQKMLWEILARPLPLAPPPKPGASVAFGIFGMSQGPLSQRVEQSFVAMNDVQQLMMASQNRGQAQMRMRMAMMRGRYNQVAVSTTLGPVAIKDHALIYLTTLAVQKQPASDFLTELEGKIEAWHWPLADRIVAYSLIQAREPLMQALEEQAKSGAPDEEIDGYCYELCDDFASQDPADPFAKRAEAVQAVLETRLSKNAQFATMAAMRRINRLPADATTDGLAKRKAAVADFLKTIDPKNAEELIGAIGVCAQVGNWEEIKKAVDEIGATDHNKWSLTTQQQLAFMPMSILQQAASTKDTASQEVVPVIMELIHLGYPASPPQRAMSGANASRMVVQFGGRFSGNYYNANAFPPPNRYFGADRIDALQPMFQQLKARTLAPAMYAALDQEEKDITDWRKIYPTLLRIYFQWWDDKRDMAIASVRKLLEQDPSDEYRELLAAMFVQQQKYDEAISVLESITARYGPYYIHTQMQLLRTARLAKNNDIGQKAGERLLALRLPRQELMQVMDDLRNVGLKDKADEIMKKLSNSGPSAILNQSMQASNQTRRTLEEASNNGKNEAIATNLARQVLNRDPLAGSLNGGDNNLRTLALSTLAKFNQLDDYISDIESRLKATPDSVRLNWLAGEAYQAVTDPVAKTVGPGSKPMWFRLSRKGDVFTGSCSADGIKWNDLFTHTIEMGPDARVGLMSLSTTEKSSESTWSDVKVTPTIPPASDAAAANPANSTSANTLPPPWESINLGEISTVGHADGNAPEMELSSPLRGKSNDTGAYLFVYQTLHGDGEIVGRLKDLTEVGNQARAGLCLRSRLDPQSPEIHFVLTGDHVDLLLDVDASRQSLLHFKRVAALDPRNQGMLMNAALQLQRANKQGDAADLFATILKADFPTAMTQSGSVLQAFQDSNRLPQLLNIIQNWTPPPLNPMGGGMADMFFPLMQIGNTLRQANQLTAAEQVFRKALTIDTNQAKQGAVAALVQVLIDENRRDIAGSEIEQWLLRDSSPAATASPPLFAFNSRGQQSQSNWLQFMGTNQAGVIIAPFVRFLELAADLGMAPKLRQELIARADKKSAPPGGLIDQDRIATVLLQIISRDPSYRAEVEKLIKDAPLTSMSMGNNLNALIILSQQLERWPEERPVALRLALAVFNGQGINQNSYFKNIAGFQVIRIARAMGDHKTAQATLRTIAESMRSQRAVNPNQVSLEQLLMVGRWMIDEGMLKEAADVFADAKTSPQVATGNTFYQQKIDQAQNELAFAKGENSPVALNYGLASIAQKHGTGTEFFWQINAGQKTQNSGNRYFSHAAWNDAAVPRATTYHLDLSGGPDEGHLVHVTSWDNVATQGHQALKIPLGVKVIRASLVRGKSGAASDLADIATGHLLFVSAPENLLKNPDFQATKDATGTLMPGWRGVPSGGVSRETGGPLPTGGYQSLEAGNNMFGDSEITADRIAIQPGTRYFFSGWVRTSVTLGVRYLDADGKVLSTNQFNLGGNDNDSRWGWCAYKFGDSDGGESFPDKTAFVEFYFRPNQDFDVAGLSFHAWPAAEPEASGAKKSSSSE